MEEVPAPAEAKRTWKKSLSPVVSCDHRDSVEARPIHVAVPAAAGAAFAEAPAENVLYARKGFPDPTAFSGRWLAT